MPNDSRGDAPAYSIKPATCPDSACKVILTRTPTAHITDRWRGRAQEAAAPQEADEEDAEEDPRGRRRRGKMVRRDGKLVPAFTAPAVNPGKPNKLQATCRGVPSTPGVSAVACLSAVWSWAAGSHALLSRPWAQMYC